MPPFKMSKTELAQRAERINANYSNQLNVRAEIYYLRAAGIAGFVAAGGFQGKGITIEMDIIDGDGNIIEEIRGSKECWAALYPVPRDHRASYNHKDAQEFKDFLLAMWELRDKHPAGKLDIFREVANRVNGVPWEREFGPWMQAIKDTVAAWEASQKEAASRWVSAAVRRRGIRLRCARHRRERRQRLIDVHARCTEGMSLVGAMGGRIDSVLKERHDDGDRAAVIYRTAFEDLEQKNVDALQLANKQCDERLDALIAETMAAADAMELAEKRLLEIGGSVDDTEKIQDLRRIRAIIGKKVAIDHEAHPPKAAAGGGDDMEMEEELHHTVDEEHDIDSLKRRNTQLTFLAASYSCKLQAAQVEIERRGGDGACDLSLGLAYAAARTFRLREVIRTMKEQKSDGLCNLRHEYEGLKQRHENTQADLDAAKAQLATAGKTVKVAQFKANEAASREKAAKTDVRRLTNTVREKVGVDADKNKYKHQLQQLQETHMIICTEKQELESKYNTLGSDLLWSREVADFRVAMEKAGIN